MSKERSLPDQLEIKAGMIEFGERIPFGSDSALMRLAATNLRCYEIESVIKDNLILKAYEVLKCCTDGYEDRVELVQEIKRIYDWT